MKQFWATVAIVLLGGVGGGLALDAHAQVYNKFGPVNGVLKGSTATYQTSAAASTDVAGLFCGTSTTSFLRADGTCAVPAGVTPSGAQNLIFATPNGSSGAASLRALVGADVPPTNLGSTANGGVASASILLGTNGGTSNGFFSVTGPATSLKTFTFPNASANVLTDAAAVTVAQGGTGVATLQVHRVLLGNGTSGINTVGSMALDTLLQGQGATSDPSPVAVNNCGDATHALSYSTTTHAFGCQAITSGGTGTVTQVNSGTGITGGPITSTGTLSVDQTASLTWTGTELFQGALSRGGSTAQVSVGLVSSLPIVVLTSSLPGTDKKSTEVLIGNSNGDFVIQTTDQAVATQRAIFQAVRGTGAAVSSISLGNSTDNPPFNFLGTGKVTFGGQIQSSSGTLSVNNSTATTVTTLPASTGTYIVNCAITTQTGNAFDVSSVVAVGSTTATAPVALISSGSMTIGMSGLNVQCTQTSGSTQTVSWAVLKVGV